MVSTIIEVKANTGSENVKMKIFSKAPLSETEKTYFASLKRDDAFKYGRSKGWKVVDIEEWV